MTLVLTDIIGNLYWQTAIDFKGDLAEFDEKGNITTGQAYQVRKIIIKYIIPYVVVETNNLGNFVPPILRKALQGNGCAVRECNQRTNKQDRILGALEPPLTSGFLYAHKEVFNSKAIESDVLI